MTTTGRSSRAGAEDLRRNEIIHHLLALCAPGLMREWT